MSGIAPGVEDVRRDRPGASLQRPTHTPGLMSAVRRPPLSSLENTNLNRRTDRRFWPPMSDRGQPTIRVRMKTSLGWQPAVARRMCIDVHPVFGA